MKVLVQHVRRTIDSWLWCVLTLMVMATVVEVASLNGPNVCMVKQKYNITKRVKYRAPMSVRTYEWCFSMPPRCSRWSTEMRDLTRLETEERTAEVAVCCPGYKMKDVSCVLICPYGKTGTGCSEDCPPNKWGPNCVHECKKCSEHGSCSPITGECRCEAGWQGESCENRITTTISTSTTSATLPETVITTTKSTTKTTALPSTKPPEITTITSRSTVIEPSSISTSSTTSTTSPTTTQKIEITSAYSTPTTKKNNEIITTLSNETHKSTTAYNKNITTRSFWSVQTYKMTPQEATPIYLETKSIYNRTEVPMGTTKTTVAFTVSSTDTVKTTTTPVIMIREKSATTVFFNGENTKPTTALTIFKDAINQDEPTRKPENTIRAFPTTIKFKPKEIWIKPTQKGESPLLESKVKPNHELPHLRYRSATKKELTSVNTTPRTIIVSIIPTSVSYSTFKKIALTTAPYYSYKNSVASKSSQIYTEQESTKSMTLPTPTSPPFVVKILSSMSTKNTSSSTASVFHQNITKPKSTVTYSTKGIITRTTKNENANNNSSVHTTNSMSTVINAANTTLKSFNSLITTPTSSSNVIHTIRTQNVTSNERTTTTTSLSTTTHKTILPTIIRKTITSSWINKQVPTILQRNTSIKPNTNETKNANSIKNITKPYFKEAVLKTNSSKRELTNAANTNKSFIIATTTDDPDDEETFHILTEPEHITAVMGEKGSERSSVDLISVISIAGGVMMAIITLAVVIVMIERCKRPRYENVRKVNDIRLQVMMDNNDVPPPYVRSIFHTPLPDPPTLEKCHYQPISTLDRNLKQFMRPVVVQTISPIMLENFRGILECHYDHLPRRSHDFCSIQSPCLAATSVGIVRDQQVTPVTESTIDALKCEAEVDEIDSTTSEPLYAEIPCWRPPSEHAIEIVNLNGEAVTEL